MATLRQQAYDAAVLNLIESAIEANAAGVHQALVNNGFAEELKYGQNGQMSQLILTQLYIGNPDQLFKILNEVQVQRTKVPPQRRTQLDEIVQTSPTARGLDDWWQKAVNFLRPTTTVTEGGEEIERTNPIAWVAYVIIAVGIFFVIRWMVRSV